MNYLICKLLTKEEIKILRDDLNKQNEFGKMGKRQQAVMLQRLKIICN